MMIPIPTLLCFSTGERSVCNKRSIQHIQKWCYSVYRLYVGVDSRYLIGQKEPGGFRKGSIYYDSRRTRQSIYNRRKAALLNSDLSRPIPDLALCMDSTNKLRTYLLTRKWGRFMWQDILQDSYDYLYKPEDVLALSGYVENRIRSPS